MKLAINGLGRVGRMALRQALSRPDLEVVLLNDLMEPRTLAHLLAFDSVHGRAPFEVSVDGDALRIDGRRIPVSREPEPAALDLHGAEVVLECTGRHLASGAVQPFLAKGARRVVVSGAGEEGRTLVVGLDHPRPGESILALGTPSLAPLALLCHILDRSFGLEAVLATDIHGYTSEQKILDLPHPNLRLARAAHASMIPFPAPRTARQLEACLPHLAGQVQVLEVRVPTPDVGMVEVNALLQRDATRDGVLEAFQAAASGPLQGVLSVLAEERVSADLLGHPASCAFDPFLTRILGPRMVKVLAWHDHEWAGAARLLDLACAGGEA